MMVYLSLINGEHRRSRFEQLYQSNRDVMFAQAQRVLRDPQLAEDAVHDAFLRMAEHMDTVERLDEWQTRRYALVAAKNAAIDLYRKRSRRAEHECFYEDMESAMGEKPGYAGPMNREENAVWQMLMELPDRYRDVFLLKYSVGLSNEEIGAVTGLTMSGVKQRITRGKSLLKEKLREEGVYGAE